MTVIDFPERDAALTRPTEQRPHPEQDEAQNLVARLPQASSRLSQDDPSGEDVDRTALAAGYIRLCRELIRPTSSVTPLRKRSTA